MNTNSQILNILATHRFNAANGELSVLRFELDRARKNYSEFLNNLEASGVFSFAELSPSRRADLEATRLAVVVAELALARTRAA